MRRIRLYFVLCLCVGWGWAQCTDKLLLDGSEPLKRIGLDTTGVWWAITQPFVGQERLVIDGYRSEAFDQVQRPVISPDGKHWATWVLRAGVWMLLVDTIVQTVGCTAPGAIVFAPNAPVLVISWYEGALETVAHGNTQYTVLRRMGSIAVSPNGEHIAWVESIEHQQRLVVDGKELAIGDAFLLGGFWYNGQLVYGQRAGNQWRCFRGRQELGGPYSVLGDVIVNRFGTVAVIRGAQAERHYVLLVSDEYTKPLSSQQYDSVWSVVCHPYLPQYGALGMRENSFVLLHTGVEYGMGRYGLAQLSFTADGTELYGYGCDVDCFFVVDGKRYGLGQDFSYSLQLARQPQSQTFAYSTPTNLFVRRIDKTTFTFSRMCDDVQPPIYNRRRQRYEALGIVQGRLYLLACK